MTEETKKSFTYLLVDWIDSQRGCEEWSYLEDFVYGTDLIIRSVGILVHEDDKEIALVLSHGLDDSTVLHMIEIPKVAIVRTMELVPQDNCSKKAFEDWKAYRFPDRKAPQNVKDLLEYVAKIEKSMGRFEENCEEGKCPRCGQSREEGTSGQSNANISTLY